MNTSCPSSAVLTPAVPARGFLVSLQKLIGRAGYVSVDLTDAIFAAMPRRDGAPPEAIVKPNCSE